MCLTTIHFFQCFKIFALIKFIIKENELAFQPRFHGLVVRHWIAMPESPGTRLTLGYQKVITFTKTLIFSQNENLSQKKIYFSNAFWLYQLGV